MKTSRLLSSLAAAAALLVVAPVYADESWLTDFKQAQQRAKADNKMLLLDFTGSDWCGWCIKLNKEVFSKPEFKEYATKNLVLMEVDFPRRKQVADDLMKQNVGLAQQFQIEAFPTIIVLNSEGKPLGALSYDSAVSPDSKATNGSPQTFIANIEKLRKG
ncbi:MAG: thioredoxin family protein [Chthoniobacterales bacterium]